MEEIKGNMESERYSVIALLEAFDDLLSRAVVQGSKIVSQTRIRELRTEVCRHLHYLKK